MVARMRNKWRAPYPYPLHEKKWEEAKGIDNRVLRGGSFDSGDDFVRCAYRNGGYPDDSNRNWGFRLVSLPHK